MTTSLRPPATGRPPRLPRMGGNPRGKATSGAVILIAVAIVSAIVWGFTTLSFDTWPALIIGPLLVLATVPMAKREAMAMGDFGFARIVLLAVCAKLAGSVARYIVAFEVYEGVADASRYHLVGAELMHTVRAGTFEFGDKAVSSTHFIEVLTGVVYAVIGPTRLGGFLVFAWLGFLGLLLFVKAHRLLVGQEDLSTTRRYAMLTFFLPSMAFWSSGIGKEAWMTLALGVSAYGFARLVSGSVLPGLVMSAVGVWATNICRPHVALILAIGAGTGLLLGRSRAGRMRNIPVGVKFLVLVMMLVASASLLNEVEDFLGVETLDSQSASDELDENEERTGQGGSSFEAKRARSLLQLPIAAFTVVFRPLPGEANNLQGVIAGIEGLILLGLCLTNLPMLLRSPRVALSNAYVGLCIAFFGGFIYGFSSVGNFGILVRQRVQMLPFLLVLLCLPPVVPVASGVLKGSMRMHLRTRVLDPPPAVQQG